MSTLDQAIGHDVTANRPAFGIPGRLYFASDTGKIWRDNGTGWDDVTPAGGGSGTVTSVGLTMPPEFTVAGSPVIGASTLAVTKATESANAVWAGPTTGSAAAPSFRALVAGDIPNIAESQVTNLTTDLAAKAPLASPALTGTPTVPTATAGTNTTQAASTAFVTAAIAGISFPVSSVFGRTGAVVAAANDYTVAQVTGAAPLASPAFTGTPTAPTPTAGDSSTKLATTAFVGAAVGAGGAVSSVFGRTGAVIAASGDYTVAQVTGAAPLASPALTGTPTAPTPAAGDNSTNIATTAFVAAGYRLVRIFSITTSGTQASGVVGTPPGPYTYTPTAGTRALYIESVGGGGGAGSANITTSGQVSISGGGGGASFAAVWLTGTLSTPYTVNIGTAGSGGTAGGAGVAGGNTTVVGANSTTYLQAAGGPAGQAGSASGTTNAISVGGYNPTPTNVGDFVEPGGPGGNGLVFSSATLAEGGGGGSSRFANFIPNSLIAAATQNVGVSATGNGGGGRGSVNFSTQSTAAAGGAGSPGVLRIWEFA